MSKSDAQNKNYLHIPIYQQRKLHEQKYDVQIQSPDIDTNSSFC